MNKDDLVQLIGLDKQNLSEQEKKQLAADFLSFFMIRALARIYRNYKIS